jgi:hypothetical protein
MKKLFLTSLMFCAFMGAVASSVDADTFGFRDRTSTPTSLPEPTTLALLAAGGAGMGIFALIRRRNRK